MYTENGNFKEFIGISPLDKTLCNELRPTEDTRRHIEEYGIIRDDEYRAEKRQELQSILDDFYRRYTEEKLSDSPELDWNGLFVCLSEYQKDPSGDNKERLAAKQKELRNLLNNHLASDQRFGNFFKAKMITDILPEFIQNHPEFDASDKESRLETVKLFARFGTSLDNYFAGRKNMFSKETIPSSICYWTVNENAEIFYQNLKAYQNIKADGRVE